MSDMEELKELRAGSARLLEMAKESNESAIRSGLLAVKAQKEARELRAELAALRTRAEAAERRVEEMRKGLEPFARVGYAHESNWSAFRYADDVLLDGADETKDLTVGDFRRVVAILSAGATQENGE